MNMLIAVAAVAAVILMVLYNRLVHRRNLVSEGWSGMDVQLKRRHDLIPGLVEIVKGYASHEQETLEEVTRLRQVSQITSDIGEKGAVESGITADIKKIFALVESYPDLKADQNFRNLQTALTETEENLQYARRYYNGTVRDLNVLVQSFPTNLVAKLFGFKEAGFFEIEDAAERQSPSVQL